MPPEQISLFESERGVTEVLGYIFIFALVVSSIGLITFAGYDSLESVQSNEQTQTAERAYEILARHIEDVYDRGAPSRATEMTLGDATLFTDTDLTKITIDYQGTATNPDVGPIEVRPIVYRSPGDQRLVYSAGATFRKTPGGGVVLDTPPFLQDSSRDTVLFNVVRTYSPNGEPQSIGGGKGIIRVRQTDQQLISKTVTPVDPVDGVEITVETSRTELWKRTLESRGFTDCTISSSAVTCEDDISDPITVLVTRHNINTELQQ